LVLLSENAHTVCFRYRLIGQMWQPHFMRVIDVTEEGVFLKDLIDHKTVLLSDLNMIMQFELDSSIHSFAPNFHYKVVPDQSFNGKDRLTSV
jgi:hypothetical protein